MISEADNQRIVEAIRAAETKTSGEIYCVIAHACGSYHLARIMHHAACLCTSVEQMRASDPSGWISVRPLAVQRVWC
jgi:putative membrane protein